MRIAEVELTRVRIPFRNTFRHAAAARSHSDAIIIDVRSDSGLHGFGEVQARTYVTGESNDDIWSDGIQDLARRLIGASVESFGEVESLLGGPENYGRHPALAGGFDIALANLLELGGAFDWAHVFGPARRSPTVKTVTIGDDVEGDDLRSQARIARLRGCSVFKLKIAGLYDVRRIHELREAIGFGCLLRLDANGQLKLDDAVSLLNSVDALEIHSLEEPFDKNSLTLIEDLEHLYEETGVALMADESICTVADVERFANGSAYQLFNVRAGKCGGVTGTAAVLSAARKAGMGLAAGTMVGESAVLLRVSKKVLEHCADIEYVEGLSQVAELFESEAIVESEAAINSTFEWLVDSGSEFIIKRINVN